MKKLFKLTALSLALAMTLSTGLAFADSQNSKSKGKEEVKIVKKVSINDEIINSLKNKVKVENLELKETKAKNLIQISGNIKVDGMDLSQFKGNTKIKIKLNNVVVNLDKDGKFSQLMNKNNLDKLVLGVYVGKVKLYEQNIDTKTLPTMTLEKALQTAREKVAKIPALENLKLTDKQTVIEARDALNDLRRILGMGAATNVEYQTMLAKVNQALERIRFLESTTLRWIEEPKLIKSNNAVLAGKLHVPDNINNLVVKVNGEIIPTIYGAFRYNVNTNVANLVVTVEVNGVINNELTRVVANDANATSVQNVMNLINALPAKENVKLSDRDDILNARANYEKLSQENKALVTNLAKLIEAELKLRELEMAQLSWTFKPTAFSDGQYIGKLNLNNIDNSRVKVRLGTAPNDDIAVLNNGFVLLTKTGTEIVAVHVYLDNVIVPNLSITIN
ncbi:hypothetical protein E8P77_02660 [Soehngenia saccharolytica]|nr:hypothetical protein E8P77_02660 [Soehngenia saccharolytica]